MTIALILLHIIVCFVLILVILLQAGRGQGLSGASFGGGNVQSLLGTKTSSFFTKATSVCAVLFLFTCIGLNAVEVQKSRSLYQPQSTQTPLDVDQIRKALDKIKKTEATGQGQAGSVETPQPDTAQTKTVASAAAEKTADTVAETAKN